MQHGPYVSINPCRNCFLIKKHVTGFIKDIWKVCWNQKKKYSQDYEMSVTFGNEILHYYLSFLLMLFISDMSFGSHYLVQSGYGLSNHKSRHTFSPVNSDYVVFFMLFCNCDAMEKLINYDLFLFVHYLNPERTVS